MKLKPCSCGFEHYVRVHRSWWMRLVGGRTRWLYECARCGARMLLPVGWIAAEGGVAGRGARYTKNRDVMVAGMRELGFETLLSDRWLSPIIVTFFCPAHEKFVFNRFYELMKDKGFIIYPGKLTVVDSFRVGCIGRMDEHVMRRVVEAAKQSLAEMGVDTAAPPANAIAERAKLAA